MLRKAIPFEYQEERERGVQGNQSPIPSGSGLYFTIWQSTKDNFVKNVDFTTLTAI